MPPFVSRPLCNIARPYLTQLSGHSTFGPYDPRGQEHDNFEPTHLVKSLGL